MLQLNFNEVMDDKKIAKEASTNDFPEAIIFH